jgi:hypothetical protein
MSAASAKANAATGVGANPPDFTGAYQSLALGLHYPTIKTNHELAGILAHMKL